MDKGTLIRLIDDQGLTRYFNYCGYTTSDLSDIILNNELIDFNDKSFQAKRYTLSLDRSLLVAYNPPVVSVDIITNA